MCSYATDKRTPVDTCPNCDRAGTYVRSVATYYGTRTVRHTRRCGECGFSNVVDVNVARALRAEGGQCPECARSEGPHYTGECRHG